jgi:glycosyltransferase involved in cell wall biosynthesis
VKTSQLRIIVTGLAGLYPVGGVAWYYLQYVLGLARLGHDVYYYENTRDWPYHPLERTFKTDGNGSAKYLGDFFESYAPELRDLWHYVNLRETTFGMSPAAFDEVARTADVFLNVSGMCFFPDRLGPRCLKVFIDTDPGYNQVLLSERFAWSKNVREWCANVAAHDRHFTYAENIHGADCLIPHVGYDWQTTRTPIVLDYWEPLARVRPPRTAPWTTVTSWTEFKGKLIYQGVEYRSKASEFEKLIDLPRQVTVPLQLALDGMNVPLERLAAYGWQVVDGPRETLTPAQFLEFLARSRGEVSPAKQVYVAMRSGWFSERSARYLAAGRPVVVQDTGFSCVLPPGEGLLMFRTLEEAAAAIQEVEGNYDRHAQAARAVAREYFDSDKILSRLLEEALRDSAASPEQHIAVSSACGPVPL